MLTRVRWWMRVCYNNSYILCFEIVLLFHPENILATFSFLNSVNSSSHSSLKIDSIAIPSTCEKGSLFYEHQSLFSIRSEVLLYHLLTQGRAEEALDVLDWVMPENGLKPSVVTYNAVMRGLFKLPKGVEAMCVFDQMAKAGVCADNTTYAIIIDGLCATGQVDTAKRFWDDVIWPSGRHDAYVYSAFLSVW